ncbi:OmpA family protein [Pseudomonas baetica]|uniref:OmpA family protein n=1 Tax=Pseudomonas baetica TaxID=674054 RepID=UPI002407200D|nr:OmpA family protein [Pseudomonas baetica]MDF9779113.1 outer membrane protein OmpA-like peptidoglycan-associated protein [Pseudomonas baetica]
MFNLLKIAVLALSLALITGCAVNPQTGEREFNRTAIGAGIGSVAGGIVGVAIGRSPESFLIGAATGAAIGGGTGYYMDRRAEKLKADLKGTGMEVQQKIDPATGRGMLTIQAPADIAFATGSADLESASFRGLKSVADSVRAQPGIRVEVTGHTDATGGQKLNQLLSLSRAQSVAQFLSASGVDGQAIAVRGVGAAMPVASNDTPAGRAKNRRVEIQIRQI